MMRKLVQLKALFLQCKVWFRNSPAATHAALIIDEYVCVWQSKELRMQKRNGWCQSVDN